MRSAKKKVDFYLKTDVLTSMPAALPALWPPNASVNSPEIRNENCNKHFDQILLVDNISFQITLHGLAGDMSNVVSVCPDSDAVTGSAQKDSRSLCCLFLLASIFQEIATCYCLIEYCITVVLCGFL